MATTTQTTVDAQINYFPEDGPRIFYPGTAGYQRRKFDTRTVQIHDVRSASEAPTLDKNGFTVAKNNWTPFSAADEETKIRDVVYEETTEFLKKLTGATEVVNFSCMIRKDTAEDVKKAAEGKNDDEGLPAAGPTRFAHCDNSARGSETVLRNGFKDDAEVEKRMKSRWGIINTWRGLRPVTRDPLAILDAQSVGPDDLVGVFSAFPKKGTSGAFGNAYEAGDGFETSQVKQNDAHQWYYCSHLQLDEALVFKQFDSGKGTARQAPHSAVSLKEDYGPVRQSIEVRSLVFWEGQE